MSKTKRNLIIAALVIVVAGLGVHNGLKILKDGAQVYLFGYSLVLMDTTRQVMTDPAGGRAPINHFAHIMDFPDHNFRQVVRPNCDTLYSTAWIDLSAEPLILSVPDTADRYYVMPFMDAYTNVFASVGKRVTGTKSGQYLVTGPNWQGEVPDGLETIRSPTNMTWLIGRIQANGKNDFPNVHKLQDQFKLTPLSRLENGEANPGIRKNTETSEGKTKNPSDMVVRMSAGEFFASLSRLMAEQPPSKEDAPVIKTLAEFGVVPGKPFDIEKQGMVRRLLLKKAVDVARSTLKEIEESDRSSENNWAVVRDGIGVYGTNYSVRAFVSLIGLGALTPAEAAYPNAIKDSTGNFLNGKNRYRIHYDAGKTPPVDAFWSLTMYDERGFLIENPINRYAIGDRDPLKFNPDGSLDILIQHERPDQGEQNWLPAPADGFAVTLRLYLPKDDFLNGTWKLPPIERIN
jgi:hypothetical protein